MRIYRVESKRNPKEGRTDALYTVTDHWSRLPCPQAEGIQMRITDVCGTTSKKSFNIWWPKKAVIKILKHHSATVHIVVLEIPKEYVSKSLLQCVFPRKKAKIVGTMDADGKITYRDAALI
jgi:hypothetical protein